MHSPEKVGRDAGETSRTDNRSACSRQTDANALIDLRPDCIVYAASGPEHDAASVPDYVRFLEAGINVGVHQFDPAHLPTAFDPRGSNSHACGRCRRRIFYASGIEPGFALDQLPLVLATQSSTIRSIHAYEIGLYDDYAVADVMMDGMGFSRPMDYEPFITIPGVVIHEWSGGIRLIADALGAEIEELRESVDRAPTERTLEVACGTIAAGTAGAIRIKAIGIIDGREAITIEHVTRTARAPSPPDWPTADHDVSYRVEIEGDPNIHLDMACSLDDPAAAGIAGMQAGAGAMVATAMRVVNAVPYVVAARPGVLSSLDIPLTLPQHALTAAN